MLDALAHGGQPFACDPCEPNRAVPRPASLPAAAMKIVTSARIAPGYGYLGYFLVYSAGSDWMHDTPVFREDLGDWRPAFSLREAIDGAHDRARHWVRDHTSIL